MCCIYCSVSATCYRELDSNAAELLSRRGPDASASHKVEVTGPRKWYLTFTSSVLSLRGLQIQKQPFIDSTTGSVFCWNGEAWLLDDNEIVANDTQVIFEQLVEASRIGAASNTVVNVLGRVKGPFAFVYYDAQACRLYFGRDVLGRRSLLSNTANLETDELTIASATFSSRFPCLEEVRTPYIFSVDLTKSTLSMDSLPFNSWSPTINKSLASDGISALPSQTSIDLLLSRLKRAVRLRIQAVPTYNNFDAGSSPSKIAVLFSGGLDCTLLARLIHDTLPTDEPIDLLNVAFENPRVVNARAADHTTNADQKIDSYESCPDRITGRSSFSELVEICSTRIWRFVAVNVPYEEFTGHRQTIIQLMHPHNTEMDLSITAALYFAARGQGEMSTSSADLTAYTTTARVLLSGLGADELFAGYARHAAAFARGTYTALNDELELDYKRIGSRNLGRDDRVITNWAREIRYPFLDEGFVEFALGLPSWEKCGFRPDRAMSKHFELLPPPEQMSDLHPEKMLLRCALWQLGMRRAAAEKKRAIQFGARTAKMHTGKSRGTDLVT